MAYVESDSRLLEQFLKGFGYHRDENDAEEATSTKRSCLRLQRFSSLINVKRFWQHLVRLFCRLEF